MMARLRALLHNDQGAIAPMVVVLMGSLLTAVGLTLDVTLYYFGNRELRSATDAAALAAAMDPANAQTRATEYLTHNGYDASVLKSVQVGYYCADHRLNASTGRFTVSSITNCAGAKRQNAVRLTTGKERKVFLTGLLGPANPIPNLTAKATATRIDEAGISITSNLIGVQGAVGTIVSEPLRNAVNGLLGSLLGINDLILSTSEIQSLMQGSIDAGLFFDALAKREGFNGTYSEMVAQSHDLQDVALAASEAAYDGTTATALNNFGSMVGRGYNIPFESIFGVGVWSDMPVGEADAQPALRASLNSYQLITYAVQASKVDINLSRIVSLALSDSTVRVRAVATNRVGRPRFAFGPANETSTSTSAYRLLIDLEPARIPVLGNPVGLKIPLLVDVQAATASLDNISCGTEQRNSTDVSIRATSGLVNVYLGEPKDSVMSNSLPAINYQNDIKQTSLLNPLFINLITVDAKARAEPIAEVNQTVLLSPQQSSNASGYSPIQYNPRYLSNDIALARLAPSLLESLQNNLKVCVTLLCLPTNGATQIVAGVTAPVNNLLGATTDPLLTNLLRALGVQLGGATVWATGARCGVPVLV